MRTYDFSPLFRYSVGFDRMQRLLDAALERSDSAPGYPPYNIEQVGENGIRITIAVAGFTKGSLILLALFAVQGFYGLMLYRRIPKPDVASLQHEPADEEPPDGGDDA